MAATSEDYLREDAAPAEAVEYRIILTAEPDGWFIAECETLQGCVSQGKTAREALENLADAMAAWLAVEKEDISKL